MEQLINYNRVQIGFWVGGELSTIADGDVMRVMLVLSTQKKYRVSEKDLRQSFSNERREKSLIIIG